MLCTSDNVTFKAKSPQISVFSFPTWKKKKKRSEFIVAGRLIWMK